MEGGLAEEDKDLREVMNASSLCIGSESFRQSIGELRQNRTATRQRPEDISFRRTVKALDPGTILSVVSEILGEPMESFRQKRRRSPLRAIAVKFLLRYGQQTQRDVARFLGMNTGSAVSVHARKYESWITEDPHLARRARRIERPLDSHRRAERHTING